MANDDIEEVENVEDEADDTEGDTEAESTSESKKEKPKRTPEQQLAYLEGRTQRLRTKLGLTGQKKPDAEKKEAKEGFDYAELAYLEVKGITDEDDIAFVEKTAKDTGKSLRELMGAKWFQAELKERKEEKAAKEAIPTGSKRSSTSARDEVDYWIAKGTLPPLDQPELRQKVVQARMKLEQGGSNFTDKPVA